jgi:hypothetical protein
MDKFIIKERSDIYKIPKGFNGVLEIRNALDRQKKINIIGDSQNRIEIYYREFATVSTIKVFDSFVEVRGHFKIIAYRSIVHVFDHCEIEARDHSRIESFDESQVVLKEAGTFAEAHGRSKVILYNGSSADMYGDSEADSYDANTINAHDWSIVRATGFLSRLWLYNIAEAEINVTKRVRDSMFIVDKRKPSDQNEIFVNSDNDYRKLLGEYKTIERDIRSDAENDFLSEESFGKEIFEFKKRVHKSQGNLTKDESKSLTKMITELEREFLDWF